MPSPGGEPLSAQEGERAKQTQPLPPTCSPCETSEGVRVQPCEALGVLCSPCVCFCSGSSFPGVREMHWSDGLMHQYCLLPRELLTFRQLQKAPLLLSSANSGGRGRSSSCEWERGELDSREPVGRGNGSRWEKAAAAKVKVNDVKRQKKERGGQK